MGVFTPPSSGPPPPIPGMPTNLSPRMQAYLQPLEMITDISGLDSKLKQQQQAGQPLKPATNIGANTIGVGGSSGGNPSIMSQVRAR